MRRISLFLLLSQTQALVMKDLESLASTANSFASANGLQVATKDGSFQCAPISLLPNAYPRSAFENAKAVAPDWNLLVDRISRDPDFLQETLGGGVAAADPYTANLLKLYRKYYVDEEDSFALKADRLGIQRSDYMLNADGNIKQVELNTIASSFASLSVQVANLHRFLVERFDVGEAMDKNAKLVGSDSAVGGGVPENPALDRLPLAMKVAYDRYVERFGTLQEDTKPIVLFVVQDGESNTVDQRMLEFALWKQHGIPVERHSLTKMTARVDEEGRLWVNDRLVAVVYYRAGYAPTDYPGGDDGVEWKNRATLENSVATKCPSLGYHLAGTKKVQQALARPNVVERYVKDAGQLRGTFAGLYSLGEDAVDVDLEAVQQVLKEGKEGQFVLKPQREGGGYNFYGSRLADKLRQNVNEDGSLKPALGEFILMERLFPPQQPAVLLRAGRVEGEGESVSELGCFGTIVCSPEGDVCHNEYAGFLLRTKFAGVDEGGVASGFATLSSPYLC